MPDVVWVLPSQLTLIELLLFDNCSVMLHARVLIAVYGPLPLESLLRCAKLREEGQVMRKVGDDLWVLIEGLNIKWRVEGRATSS